MPSNNYLPNYSSQLPASVIGAHDSSLEQHELTKFFEELKRLLARFPYQLFTKAQERTCHGFILSLLSGMGIEVAAETPSNLGRLDLLVQVDGTTYSIEVKLDGSPEEGVAQILGEQYHLPYLTYYPMFLFVG